MGGGGPAALRLLQPRPCNPLSPPHRTCSSAPATRASGTQHLFLGHNRSLGAKSPCAIWERGGVLVRGGRAVGALLQQSSTSPLQPTNWLAAGQDILWNHPSAYPPTL